MDELYLPWGITANQPVMGSAIALSLWMFKFRPAPRLTTTNAKAIAPIALCHALTLMCTTIGLGGTRAFDSMIWLVRTGI